MADRAEPSVREAPVLDRPPIEDLTFGAPLTRHVSASPAAPVRATGWRSWVTAVATIVTLVVGIPLFSTGVARVIMALEAPSAEPSGRLLQDVVERLDRDRGVQACGVASGATLDIPLTVGADLGVHFPNPPAPPIERCLAERLTQLVDAARPDGVAHPTVLHLTSTPLMRDRRVEPANDAATQSCFRYFATRDAWRRGWRGVVSAAEPGGERSVDVTIHGVDHPELGRCLTETGAFDPRVDPPIVGNVGDLPGTR